jgi:hypothetical protein
MKLLSQISCILFFATLGFSQPANDNPCAATALTIGASCTYATYTNAAATASAGVPAPGCASYSGGDVWFSVTVPANGQVTADMNTGVMTDSGMGFYTGTCGSLTLLSCDDDSSPNGLMSMIAATGLTPGTTLFIRVWEYGNNNNGTFSICVTSPAPVAPITNDEPCTAISIPVGSSCTYTAGTTVGSTNSAGIPAPGCASYSGPDVWYSLVVPANGAVQINSNTGTTTDGGMAIYSGACGSLTLISCDDDSSPNGAMPMISATGLTAGSTIYIRMWDYGGGTGTFSLCATTMTACGGAANNDYCPYPALLTPGAGNFSATTDVTFTQDQPGNLSSVFCGSIENNSWYQFTATATTATFPIVSVTGCVSSYGIQAQVYSVTYNASGCCTGFTSVSNCYNPGTTTLGSVNATGLTVGNQYLLMIDGNAGDGCEFTISGWTATGILPIELVQFDGSVEEFFNELTWQTASEDNNDYFEINHSADGQVYKTVGTIDGAGTTTETHRYSFDHYGAPEGLNYYQLTQVDKDGRKSNSKIIALYRKTATTGLVGIFPNPTNAATTLVIQTTKTEDMQLSVIDPFGQLVFSSDYALVKGSNEIQLHTETWADGMYTISTKIGNTIQHQRLIKTH